MESTEKPICPKCCEALARAKKCIRAHPEEAAITSLSAGFFLAQLPLRNLVGALVRMIRLLLKPAAMLYLLYRLTGERDARRHPEQKSGEQAAPEAEI